MENNGLKKERLKPTPEELFNVYLECNTAGAPVKGILERHSLKPWDLVTIRKKVRAAAVSALSGNGERGRRRGVVAVEDFRKVSKELEYTKEALVAVGHELALLKKRVS